MKVEALPSAGSPLASPSRPDWLIFSDLDGSLLDSRGRLPEGNRQTLYQLERQSIPIIFTSSKTRQEILHLQSELGIHQAFIPENGAGIYVPEGHPLTAKIELMPWGHGRGLHFGVPYSYIRAVFTHLRDQFGIRGMADMSIDELVVLTGLDPHAIQRALAREFSEPFVFEGQLNVAQLQKALISYGLAITRGGRFFHMMSAMQDKGKAVAKVIQLFRLAGQSRPCSVALGDAENDFSMLRAVDYAILLRRDDGSIADLDLNGLRRAERAGCEGWREQLELLMLDPAPTQCCREEQG
jgi:mannosyl-3-phosphoglycerate phosphatase